MKVWKYSSTLSWPCH